MEKGWERIYSTDKAHMISIVRSMLKENDIESIEINKKDSSYAFGDIEIFVKEEDVIFAKILIKQNHL
jgi:Putative prokaryotic signal transducing protein